MNLIRKRIRKAINYIMYGKRADSASYVNYLRNLGMQIGEGTKFILPISNSIDVTRPWMISIGEGCCITAGVTILTHDYGWSVCKAVYGDIVGSAGLVTIGDHVYIGMHSTILGGVTIGNNVIIGANSVVTKSIQDNVVAAGNPARIIRTLDEYHDKRKKAELNEAVDMVRRYKEVYGKEPPIEVMREHFWLFEDDYDHVVPEFKSVIGLVFGTEEKSKACFAIHKKLFNGYGEFLEYCFKDSQNI